MSSLDKDSLKEKSLELGAKWNNLADSISYFGAEKIPKVIFIGIRSLNRFMNDPTQTYSERVTEVLVKRIIQSLAEFKPGSVLEKNLFLADKEYYNTVNPLLNRYHHISDEDISKKRNIQWDEMQRLFNNLGSKNFSVVQNVQTVLTFGHSLLSEELNNKGATIDDIDELILCLENYFIELSSYYGDELEVLEADLGLEFIDLFTSIDIHENTSCIGDTNRDKVNKLIRELCDIDKKLSEHIRRLPN